MAEVRLRNVAKRFDNNVIAVDSLSLDIADGEFLVLLGPSGCGKTTTLRMVAGLETVTEGEIYIGDRQVNQLPPGDRDIAFVFQFYALYPHLSVRDNIAFPLKAQQVSKEETERRVNEIADTLQIRHVLNRRPNRLPSGEQQRVALGRAMVRQPQVFLMDEPLTNLDASLRADMRVELKHLQQELGTTMLYVTHDQIEAMSMSHRIAVMNQGILQQVGTPLAIYNHPQTLFVATFIGSPPMNIIPCSLDAAGMLHGADSDFELPLSPAVLAQARAHQSSGSQPVIFGVRSEAVALVHGDGAADLHGVVLVREPLGDETIYQIDIGGRALLAKTPPRQIFQPGERVGIRFDQARIHLFDPDTERALLGEAVAV